MLSRREGVFIMHIFTPHVISEYAEARGKRSKDVVTMQTNREQFSIDIGRRRTINLKGFQITSPIVKIREFPPGNKFNLERTIIPTNQAPWWEGSTSGSLQIVTSLATAAKGA
ncbi:hypothetical protein BDV40DRAFT_270179 [Aspergillus tamarii]|uniref:Uncharacterized protein n=1 Tax=Aspergillus tamarii TaxID=41984 RepID=A0A5N6UPJ4_ASPTM|nr:hypothetical protein BDV40DRAFT_270179 [Aspergillus tamarii]